MDLSSDPIFIALGGNRGPVLATFRWVVRRLPQLGIGIERVSPAYPSPALPRATLAKGERDPDFWNAVLLCRSSLDPEEVLEVLLQVEREAGRLPGPAWGPRCLDLDLLAYGQRSQNTARLVLPHPRAAERAFVLRPWLDLDPTYQLPSSALTIHEMWARLPNDQVASLGQPCRFLEDPA